MDKLTISYDQYKGLVSSICRDIMLDDWRPDYVVGITRGGLLPAVMISHYFDAKCHTLKVSLRDSESDCESNCWMAEDAYGITSNREIDFYEEDPTNLIQESMPKNILIVDDINDTGATMNWIMNDWQSGCHPKDDQWNNIWNNNVRFAVIVDNLSSECNVKMDYAGLIINKSEKDVWIDFPYEEWWK